MKTFLFASCKFPEDVVVPEVRKLSCDEISQEPSRWDFTGYESKHGHLIDYSFVLIGNASVLLAWTPSGSERRVGLSQIREIPL
jgi:hypothetical protein